MNSIWNSNYSAFRNRFPQLAELLPCDSVPVIPAGWQVSEAKNGQFTITENGIRLHSSYNPQREAAGAVATSEVNSKSTTVFYGFGLGYHLVEWAKIHKDKKLIIIEPDVNIFLYSMSILDWTEIFSINQLVLAVGCPAESVLPLIESSDKVNIGETGVSDAFYFDIPAFTRHAQNYFDVVKTLVKRNQRKNEINAATLKKFGKLWCRNSIKNLQEMIRLNGIKTLKEKTDSELPFMIVGAGPSLEKILPYLKSLKERCVIVCVETALKAMLRIGVEPDFIVLTDPQFWAYRHIAGLSAHDSILITEISTYPAVFRFPCKQILLCGSQFPIGQYFEQQLSLDLGDLGTGGSVASSAWNFAGYCGAKKIYTAGLDFAFPKNQTHIKGSSAEQTFHTISNKLAASDKFTANALYSANAVMGKDYNGAPVLTDSRMKMFSWWFESRLAACKDVQTYTFTPEGLNTPGIHPTSLSDFLKNTPSMSVLKKQFFENLNNATENKKISNETNSLFNKLMTQFPTQDFEEKYSFLKPYL